METIKVGLDIDDVIGDFSNHYFDWLNLDKTPATTWEDARFVNHFSKIKDDVDFWLSIPFLITADELKFKPNRFVTARGIDSEITKKWLKGGAFENIPVYTVPFNASKVDFVKGVDVFVDDALHNYFELNDNGINCFLMNRSHNEKKDSNCQIRKRIYHLNDLCNINPRMLSGEIKQHKKILVTDESLTRIYNKEMFICYWEDKNIWGVGSKKGIPEGLLQESQFKILD